MADDQALTVVKSEPLPSLSIVKSEPPPARTWADTGRDVATGALNALPMVGGIVGGALSTPETLGTGTAAGVALGIGAGRGARDLIAESTGLEDKTTPESKAGRIAIDTALSYVWQSALPGLVEAAKTPGQTAGELYETFKDHLPVFLKRLAPSLPTDLVKAPAAALLERPAWQTWAENAAITPDTPTPVKPSYSAIDVTRVKDLMKQGVSQGDALSLLGFLKGKGAPIVTQ